MIVCVSSFLVKKEKKTITVLHDAHNEKSAPSSTHNPLLDLFPASEAAIGRALAHRKKLQLHPNQSTEAAK